MDSLETMAEALPGLLLERSPGTKVWASVLPVLKQKTKKQDIFTKTKLTSTIIKCNCNTKKDLLFL